MQEWKVRVCRPLTDAEPCLEIYRPYVEQTAITFEYTVPSVTEFQHRMEHTLKRYPYLVIEKDGKIGGYAYASPFKERAAYAYSVELSIYLDMSLRHQGLGKQLYICLEDVLKLMGVCNVNACIGVPREGEELPFWMAAAQPFTLILAIRWLAGFTAAAINLRHGWIWYGWKR